MSDNKDDVGTNNHKNLNDLLDNALNDFNNTTDRSRNTAESQKQSETSEEWNDQFFADQVKLLDEQMSSLFGAGGTELSPEQINVGFQKMLEAAAKVSQGDVGGNEEPKYAESIKEALKSLKEGVDNLGSPVVSEADVAHMFSSLTLNESRDVDGNPFLPFMQEMMQSLLSAEILLPSIKELLEKYPKYLEENASKIKSADKERFVKQQELFEIICKDLQSEKQNDTAQVKQERFKNVLDNMQKLHEYGQPPEELIGAISASLPGLKEVCQGDGQFPFI